VASGGGGGTVDGYVAATVRMDVRVDAIVKDHNSDGEQRTSKTSGAAYRYQQTAPKKWRQMAKLATRWELQCHVTQQAQSAKREM